MFITELFLLAPPAVGGLQIIEVSENSLTIGWNGFQIPEIIISYEVVVEHIDPSSTKSTNVIKTWRNNTEERQMTVTGLQSDQLYSVKVSASHF